MIYNDCRDCEFYKGDCGKHFKDTDDHIIYTTPREVYMDGVLGAHGSCFKPSKKYQEEQRESLVKKIVSEYSTEDILLVLNKLNSEGDK